MCRDEPIGRAHTRRTTSSVRSTLRGRNRRDVLAILELVECLVLCRDWDGLTELFSDI
jgi:hypothetical protein